MDKFEISNNICYYLGEVVKKVVVTKNFLWVYFISIKNRNYRKCDKLHGMVAHPVLTNTIGDKVENKLSDFGLHISHGKGRKALFCCSCCQVNLAGREKSGLCLSRSLHFILDLS